jgi:hypothetical protein
MTFTISDASDHRKPQGLHGLRAVKQLSLGSRPNLRFHFSGFSIMPRFGFCSFFSVFFFFVFLVKKHPVADRQSDQMEQDRSGKGTNLRK